SGNCFAVSNLRSHRIFLIGTVRSEFSSSTSDVHLVHSSIGPTNGVAVNLPHSAATSPLTSTPGFPPRRLSPNSIWLPSYRYSSTRDSPPPAAQVSSVASRNHSSSLGGGTLLQNHLISADICIGYLPFRLVRTCKELVIAQSAQLRPSRSAAKV